MLDDERFVHLDEAGLVLVVEADGLGAQGGRRTLSPIARPSRKRQILFLKIRHSFTVAGPGQRYASAPSTKEGEQRLSGLDILNLLCQLET